MRQLLPEQRPLPDLDRFEAELPRAAVGGRPWVLCNMIASADGATDVGGRSGPLGGPADRALFRALRGLADVILVGAETVRQERYGIPAVADDVRRQRQARGQAPNPRLAVVTASGALDASLGLFDDAEAPPLVLTTEAVRQRGGLADRAEVVACGDPVVDLGLALALLHDRGVGTVLVEGGPRINGQLLAADLVDEWRLTVSPVLVAGDSSRPAVGGDPAAPPRFHLDRILAGGDLVFLRYLRRGQGA